jgi:hypothetical protein
MGGSPVLAYSPAGIFAQEGLAARRGNVIFEHMFKYGDGSWWRVKAK